MSVCRRRQIAGHRVRQADDAHTQLAKHTSLPELFHPEAAGAYLAAANAQQSDAGDPLGVV